MTKKELDWKPDTSLPTGKGATTQRFRTNDGQEDLAIETTPWGEGELTAGEQDVADVDSDQDGPSAFRHLKRIANDYEDARDAFAGKDAVKGDDKNLPGSRPK